MIEVVITPWEAQTEPTEAAIKQLLAREGLLPYRWSNRPADVYGAHSHPYDKVIYVLSGSILFGLPQLEQELALKTGDRLDLPKNFVHNAVVGSEGVVCLEAHR